MSLAHSFVKTRSDELGLRKDKPLAPPNHTPMNGDIVEHAMTFDRIWSPLVDEEKETMQSNAFGEARAHSQDSGDTTIGLAGHTTLRRTSIHPEWGWCFPSPFRIDILVDGSRGKPDSNAVTIAPVEAADDGKDAQRVYFTAENGSLNAVCFMMATDELSRW